MNMTQVSIGETLFYRKIVTDLKYWRDVPGQNILGGHHHLMIIMITMIMMMMRWYSPSCFPSHSWQGARRPQSPWPRCPCCRCPRWSGWRKNDETCYIRSGACPATKYSYNATQFRIILKSYNFVQSAWDNQYFTSACILLVYNFITCV